MSAANYLREALLYADAKISQGESIRPKRSDCITHDRPRRQRSWASFIRLRRCGG